MDEVMQTTSRSQDISDPVGDSLWTLLLEPQGEAAPLVRNLSELAQAVYPDVAELYKDPASLLATLSAVLNGKRTCRGQLKLVILRFISDLASSRSDVDAAVVVQRAERIMNVIEQAGSVRCERLDFASLLHAISSCKSLAAALPTGVLNDTCGQHVIDTLLARLTASESTNPKCRFLFPSEGEAVSFWLEIRNRVIIQQPNDSPEGILATLRALEKSVVVIVVDRDLCMFGCAIVNPDQSEVSDSFLLDVYSPGWASLSRLSREAAKSWVRSAFPRVLESEQNGKVTFTQALDSAKLSH